MSLLLIVALTSKNILAETPKRPNIVYLLADDLGGNDVSFRGSPIQTPNIDKLANGGAKLEDFYVQPVCSPTRASIMTGRYPMRYGLQVGVINPWAQYGLALNERTLASALKEAGYETAIVGKWHLGHFQSDFLPTHRGFDHQYGQYNGMIDYFDHTRDGGFDWHKDDSVNRDQGYSTELLANEAVRIINESDDHKPLFLYVPFNAAHVPFEVPSDYEIPYQHMQKPRRIYAGMIAAMDKAIGQIVAALDERGMRENTLIIFSSDNGGFRPGVVADNGALRAGKGTLYEGGVRVVACANWEGVLKAGTVVKEPLHAVDLFPTILKLAGVELTEKASLDGKDAWPTIAKGQPSPHSEILINATPHSGAIRIGAYKLVINGSARDEEEGAIVDRNGPEKIELFNLVDDISETNNLARSMPGKVREMRARYDVLAKQAASPLRTPEPSDFQAPKVWGEQ